MRQARQDFRKQTFILSERYDDVRVLLNGAGGWGEAYQIQIFLPIGRVILFLNVFES